MSQEHGKLRDRIRELSKAMSALQKKNGDLLTIINRPGFTTPRESELVSAHVEALHKHVAATHESYASLIEVAAKIGWEPGEGLGDDLKPHVKLIGDELQRARDWQKAAEENLGHIATMTLEKLGRKTLPLGPRGIARIVVMPNNSVVCFYQADPIGGTNESCGVYDDEAGVCREATAEDTGSADGGGDAGGGE